LPDEDFGGAVRIAQAEFDRHQPEVVVGSSRGWAVAMKINSGEARLVLLCPAWKKYGSARAVKPDTVILHSRADDVVPFADSEELVKTSGLPAWTLIGVGGDHRLADSESLEATLEACLVGDEGEAGEGEEGDILERDWTGPCYTAAPRWVRTGIGSSPTALCADLIAQAQRPVRIQALRREEGVGDRREGVG
jgi:hypothetical protein